MRNVTYGVTEEKYSINGDVRNSYGIACYSDVDECGSATIIRSVRDITSDYEMITEVVRKFNTNKLSLIHFDNVVDDIFG